MTIIACAQVLTNTRTKETYILHQCGAPVPELSLQMPTAKVFTIPLQSIATPDSTILGYLVRM